MMDSGNTLHAVRLTEISIIRPILILLLVFYHAFCIYNSGWPAPDGIIVNIPLYKWLDKFSFSFLLPSFVFISGYVWEFQNIKKGIPPFSKLLVTKARRLLLPSLLFGVIYSVLFENQDSMLKRVYDIVSGVGHLWFLPMLFWVFLFAYFLRVSSISNTFKVCICVGLGLFGIMPLPLRINSAFYYLQFFCLGVCFKHISFCTNRNVLVLRSVLLWLLFFIVFFPSELLCNAIDLKLDPSSEVVAKVSLLSAKSILRTIVSYNGCIALYMISLFISYYKSISPFIIGVGAYCFGVYVFQQFVLKWLYYYTSLPLVTGSLLPWIGFLITLIVSLLLTWAIRLTKIGRMIL